MILRVFGISLGVTVVALVAALLYGGPQALQLVAVLSILEVSLSFDNAVVNAGVLRRMNGFWQCMFLSLGLVIAVFGMRLAFPLLVVWITAHLNPVAALQLAMHPPTDGHPSYAYLLESANIEIASFGATFLLMLFLNYFFTEHEITWLSWVERPLASIGRTPMLSVVTTLVALVCVAEDVAPDDKVDTVMVAGALGMVTYLVVDGLASRFGGEGSNEGPSAPVRAGLFLFLYLEVLDASFSFDGVIGAFAITTDPVLIMLGLGLIGALFVRSITVYLVHRGALTDYVYLESGAHWAIGALAIILLMSTGYHVNATITGLVGVGFIAAAFVGSVARNHRNRNVVSRSHAHAEISRY